MHQLSWIEKNILENAKKRCRILILEKSLPFEEEATALKARFWSCPKLWWRKHWCLLRKLSHCFRTLDHWIFMFNKLGDMTRLKKGLLTRKNCFGMKRKNSLFQLEKLGILTCFFSCHGCNLLKKENYTNWTSFFRWKFLI